MNTDIAYCSGCGHQVRLAFTDPPPHDGQANLKDGAEVVCLDFKEACSGGKCPATGRPGVVMGVRLAKSHLNDEAFKTVHARCEGCAQIQDLEVLTEELAICPGCNTTNRWVTLKLADDTEITLTSR
ncbi:MAG: hypothetical protein OEZ65_14010 [Gemmatimonadota bacterium]|nr:hypothetical protein [Gemmatimonadota bacterium]MDH5760699.1 hypothetical protein [Gemmatimonadota bacterium]